MYMTLLSEDLKQSGPSPVLIKVGGSLLTWPELPARLTSFLTTGLGHDLYASKDIVLIAGGGPAADLIRMMDQIHGLGDLRAHRLAIEALDLTAKLLAEILPGSAVVHRPEALRSIWNLGRLPILSPGKFLQDLEDQGVDPLPASWDVTSDTISARIAFYLGARRLILLKSRALPQGAGLDEAASLGFVDSMFPASARKLKHVVSVCLRDVQPVLQVLSHDP
jgi:aspartokinase-like uncharacterized kinase